MGMFGVLEGNDHSGVGDERCGLIGEICNEETMGSELLRGGNDD